MADKTFLEQYGAHLNREQLEAVQSIDGFVLLLAVPGSGKTTVLVTRLGNMVFNHGISPDSILALTYTRAATKDMEQRFRHIFSDKDYPGGLEFRTINSISLDIIRYTAQQLQRKMFNLVDDKAQYKIVYGLYVEILKEYPTESEVNDIIKEIAYCKNMMLTDEGIKKRGDDLGIPLLVLYSRYDENLRGNGLMDYDDQLRYAYANLIKRPEVLEHYQDKYKYICVDEAQDTSKIQHEIIRLLAGKNKNLFMVGDEDQSIYGFRAAYPEALLNFEKRFPGGRVLVMDYNYRSNANIVSAADYFVQHNKLRHKKNIKPTRSRGLEIEYPVLSSRGAQYNYLLNVLAATNHQVAVLYRNNESGLPLVDLLDRNKVPYRIRQADVSFFTNRVVIDVTDIIRFAMNPSDKAIFMRIYTKLHTYLKKTSAEEACKYAEHAGITIVEALDHIDDISDSALKKWMDIKSHLKVLLHESPEKALVRIEKHMGYGEYLEDKHIDSSKLFTLRMIARNEETVTGLLKRLDILKELISNTEPDYKAKVVLSTIHSSKGLEYDEVFLIDVCDSVFPNKPGYKNKGLQTPEYIQYEEERRIFYVGATRAKDKLTVLKYNGAYSSFANELEMEKKYRERSQKSNVNKNSGTVVTQKTTSTSNKSRTATKSSGYMGKSGGGYKPKRPTKPFKPEIPKGAKCKHCGDDGKCWKRDFFKYNTSCNRPEKCSSFKR
ncbi:ATP-dependent helicase [Butyrivibrio sp. FCS006]|uniref:ATP-dependent helicase n=1 Tax=Butyrivibrio sp. FCS006 TaxID=1280684 RepID=UPI000424F147|nr:ATP-dependent helicase [Butyrivibrio sp. FCS006]